MPKIAMVDAHHYPVGEYDDAARMCAEASIEFSALDCRDGGDVLLKASDADVLIVNNVTIDQSLVAQLTKCKMVISHGIGVDNFDLRALRDAGIFACNVPDYGVEEVAAHTLALLLALERKIVPYAASTQAGQWNENIGYEMRRLSSRTLGFIGFGRIARKLAGFTAELGYTNIFFDPYVNEVSTAPARAVALQGIFRESDAVVVMAPATEETRHIVNEMTLREAKPGLMVVNTSRGSLVDLAALCHALESGVVAAAALDVLEEEPPTTATLDLLRKRGVIITPHVAYRTVESFQSLKRMCAELAIHFLKGGEPYNIVNDLPAAGQLPQSIAR